MGKFFFSFLLFSIMIIKMEAQSMKLTPNDFVDAADESKNYVVLNFAGKSQSELYKAALKYVNSIYNFPERVTTKIENEQIVIDAMIKNIASWGWRDNLDFYYKI